MIGKAYQNYELSQPNMCIIPEDLPVNTVFNKLQDIFILYDQWNQSLMDSRLRNASIQELLDLTTSIIPNPMMLIGMDLPSLLPEAGTWVISPIPFWVPAKIPGILWTV